MADTSEVYAHTAADPDGHGSGEHAGPALFGLGAGGWVGVAMLAFLAILAWKGVHKAIAGGLDAKIADIRKQLDEAKALRAEAEALRQEYADKIANAEKDAGAMLEHARHEADTIVEKAENDTKTMIERRKKMADEKIAAAERSAIEELRATTAAAAASAARRLIAEKHDPAADSKLVDDTISTI